MRGHDDTRSRRHGYIYHKERSVRVMLQKPSAYVTQHQTDGNPTRVILPPAARRCWYVSITYMLHCASTYGLSLRWTPRDKAYKSARWTTRHHAFSSPSKSAGLRRPKRVLGKACTEITMLGPPYLSHGIDKNSCSLSSSQNRIHQNSTICTHTFQFPTVS